MTCNIGLSTTAFSSGIPTMTEEFGVINVVGQIGMFTYAPLSAHALDPALPNSRLIIPSFSTVSMLHVPSHLSFSLLCVNSSVAEKSF